MKYSQLALLSLLLPIAAQADNSWTGRVGASWGLGKMGAGDSAVENRTMNTLGVDAMPGFRFHRISAGLNFNYRIVNQNTEAANVGGTNLRGKGWLLGPAATYHFSDQLSLTAALNFFGHQTLALPTTASYEFKYRKPLGLKLIGDYRLPGKLPLFAGASFDWVKYRGREVNSVASDLDPSVKHWNFALSIAYLFGLDHHEPAPERTEEPVAAVEEKMPVAAEAPKADGLEEDLAHNFSAKRDTEGGLSVQLSGGMLFAPYKTEVSAGEAMEKLRAVAEALKKHPSATVRIEGHSDTSGKAAQNKLLSRKRAESVRAALVKMGVAAGRIEAVGMGSEKPAESNETAEGRAANRRVEFHFSER